MTKVQQATCAVDDCEQPKQRRGWCSTHYQRWWRHGDPLIQGRKLTAGLPALERFWLKVEIADCWTWTEGLNTGGYGAFFDGEGMVRAHRWLWTVLVGPIADDLQLDHLCRNRACVNPDHLEPVTARENMRRSTAAVRSRIYQRSPQARADIVARDARRRARSITGPSGRAKRDEA